MPSFSKKLKAAKRRDRKEGTSYEVGVRVKRKSKGRHKRKPRKVEEVNWGEIFANPTPVMARKSKNGVTVSVKVRDMKAAKKIARKMGVR